jgi:hypothetical protein
VLALLRRAAAVVCGDPMPFAFAWTNWTDVTKWRAHDVSGVAGREASRETSNKMIRKGSQIGGLGWPWPSPGGDVFVTALLDSVRSEKADDRINAKTQNKEMSSKLEKTSWLQPRSESSSSAMELYLK